MVKTKFDRIDTGIPGVAAFRIGGKLGFHENTKIHRLVEECMKREFHAVVVDFSELSSLGGGVAKILREFDAAISARGGRVNFVVTNDIIAQFLQDGTKQVLIYRSFAEAIAAAQQAAPRDAPAKSDAAPVVNDAKEANAKGGRTDTGVICMPYEAPEADSTANGDAAAHGDPAETERCGSRTRQASSE